MPNEVFTDLAPGRQNADHTFGHPCGFETFGQHVGRERPFGRRLQHHRAACGQRRTQLQRGAADRRVPRDDRADHPDGFADDADVVITVDAILGEGHPLMQSSGLSEHLNGHRVQRPTERHRGADFRGEHLGEVRHTLLDLVGDPVQKLAALLGAGLAPGSLKGLPRRCHRSIDVGRRRFRDVCDDLLRAGRDHLDLRIAGRFDPFATHVQLLETGYRFLVEY